MASDNLTNNLTILNTLPVFAGNPRVGETPFRSDIDARTFLRSLDSYFACNNVDSDERKAQILFSMVDKKRGDALDFATGYAGKNVPWEAIKTEFLLNYPSSTYEIRQAAKALIAVTIDEKHPTQGSAKLERISQAVTEAYLSTTSITQGNIDMNTELFNKIAGPTVRDDTPPDTADARDKEKTKDKERTQVAEVPGYKKSPVTLADVIHNVLMHVMLAATVSHKVYDKLEKLGPTTSSTRFRAEVVNAAAKVRARQTTRAAEPIDECVWKTTDEVQQRPYRRPPTGDQQRKPLKCYNCNQEGHIKRDCSLCAYCKGQGHKVRDCAKRIKEAKGKFCRYCKIHDSHNTTECLKKKAATRSNGNVRMVQPDENTMFDTLYYEDSTDYDSSDQ